MTRIEEVFLSGEGDAYWRRNREQLESPKRAECDPVLAMMSLANLVPKKALEVGCANGWRLAEIRKRYGSECFGIDPSAEAISAGASRWPGLYLAVGQAHTPLAVQFDLVIVYFVLHWVSDLKFSETLKAIVNNVSPGGFLVIGDFMAKEPFRTPYHHLPGKDVWTYHRDIDSYMASCFPNCQRRYALDFWYGDGEAIPQNRSRISIFKKEGNQ